MTIPALISTPDRRVRVFVSSTLQELAPERAAARDSITGLHLTPVMFELGARPHPARELYRAYLAQSEVFVGIYWQQYGWVAPGEETSVLEDEYLLCGDKPKLIYAKRAAGTRDTRLTGLLARVQSDDRASYKPFDSAEDLAGLLADDLAVLLTERFARSAERPAQELRQAALPVPPTEIIDRRAETALVGDLLRDPSVHLVTLIGSGGIGKTRLAIEVARGWAEAVAGAAGSAWFVDLAPVRDPALWAEALAGARDPPGGLECRARPGHRPAPGTPGADRAGQLRARPGGGRRAGTVPRGLPGADRAGHQPQRPAPARGA